MTCRTQWKADSYQLPESRLEQERLLETCRDQELLQAPPTEQNHRERSRRSSLWPWYQGKSSNIPDRPRIAREPIAHCRRSRLFREFFLRACLLNTPQTISQSVENIDHRSQSRNVSPCVFQFVLKCRMDSRTCGSRECQRRLKFWIRLSLRFDKFTNIDFQLLIDDFRFDPTACFEVIDTTDTRSTFVQPGVDGIPAPTESPRRARFHRSTSPPSLPETAAA